MGHHHKHSHHGFTTAGVICIGISWIWYGTDLFIILLTVGIVSFLIGACLHAKKHRESKYQQCEYVTVTETVPVVYQQQPYVVAQYPNNAYPQQPQQGYPPVYAQPYPPQQTPYTQAPAYPQPPAYNTTTTQH